MSTTVWLSPSATAYACLCEECLEAARLAGALFAEALVAASVRGSLSVEVETATRRCRAGHEIVLRRGERPAGLQRHTGQLQIV